LIVVEDPFSAYAAAEYGYRGCALLGVHVPQTLEEYLLQYEEIVVALDNDATGKAARLCQQLSYLNVRQLFLEKDIKDMNLHERSSLLGNV
jgi:DNA primase